LPTAKEVFAFYSPCGILLNGNSGELPTSFLTNLFFAALRRDKSRLYGRTKLCVIGDSFFVARENLISDEFSAFILMVTQAE
jgi:hypothetical protein